MKAIAINGSPRLGGNTEYLLNSSLEVLGEKGIDTELIQTSGKCFKGCIACGACRNKPGDSIECVIKDDDFHEVFDKMVDAQIIIVGSPVYFGSATPELMAILDRAGYIGRPHNVFERKLGGPVAVARRAGENFTFAQLMYWFMINGMVMPGSSYWNVSLARDKGDAEKDEEGVKTVRKFAENLAWLSEKLY